MRAQERADVGFPPPEAQLSSNLGYLNQFENKGSLRRMTRERERGVGEPIYRSVHID